MTTATKARKSTGADWTIGAPELKAALAATAPAVQHRHPTQCAVRLGDGVAETCNGELRIQADLPECTQEPVLLPHERLTAIVGCVAGAVSFARQGACMAISAGNGKWVLPIIDNDWTARNETASKPFLRLPVDQFGRMVAAVIDATDTESSRYALGGILVEQKRGDVAFVGTDGRRLHVAYAEVDQAVDDATAIIPAAAMKVLDRLAKTHGDEAIQLTLAGSEVAAEMNGVTVWARLLEGRFPRWADVIPQALRTDFGSGEEHVHKLAPPHAEATAGELLAAVRQASIVTTETSRGVLFSFVPNGLMLTGKSAEAGESTVTADLTVAGITASVSLNPAYVSGWLRNIDPGATVEVFATDADSAVVLRHEETLAVVMPLAAE